MADGEVVFHDHRGSGIVTRQTSYDNRDWWGAGTVRASEVVGEVHVDELEVAGPGIIPRLTRTTNDKHHEHLSQSSTVR